MQILEFETAMLIWVSKMAMLVAENLSILIEQHPLALAMYISHLRQPCPYVGVGEVPGWYGVSSWEAGWQMLWFWVRDV
jgi:hypothetical protein